MFIIRHPVHGSFGLNVATGIVCAIIAFFASHFLDTVTMAFLGIIIPLVVAFAALVLPKGRTEREHAFPAVSFFCFIAAGIALGIFGITPFMH